MATKNLTNYNSPLRYPGGKGKITRFVANLLQTNEISETYVEPFAGGAGIAVNLLLSGRVQDIVINDFDNGVHSFWETVVSKPETLISAIKKVPFDTERGLSDIGAEKAFWYWFNTKTRYEINRYRKSEDRAFDFFMLNRMNVSGIIKGGPIGGEKQSGTYNISSRFNKKNLITRIENLADIREHITVTSQEASFFLKNLSQGRFCDQENCLVFADPPYYVQGRNLYNTYATDRIHQMTAERLLEEHQWRWILTYDEAPEIQNMYPDEHVNKFEYEITYSANKRGRYREYFFTDPRLDIASFDNVVLNMLSK